MNTKFDPSLPLENPKEEKFVQGLLEGKSQAKAYADAGYSDHGSNANRMRKGERVTERLNHLLSQLADLSFVSVELATEYLLGVRERAAKVDDYRLEASVTMDIAKLNGLLVDKREVEMTSTVNHNIMLETPDFTKEQRQLMLDKNTEWLEGMMAASAGVAN